MSQADSWVNLQKMRLRRIERGALTLASAEVKFQIDTETHDPLDIGMFGCQISFIVSIWMLEKPDSIYILVVCINVLRFPLFFQEEFSNLFIVVVKWFILPGMYEIREANQMVEEFMLAANVSVAEKILNHFPLCSLLR